MLGEKQTDKQGSFPPRYSGVLVIWTVFSWGPETSSVIKQSTHGGGLTAYPPTLPFERRNEVIEVFRAQGDLVGVL